MGESAGSFDASVRLWDTRAGSPKAMMMLTEARDSVSCVCVVEAEIWAGSVDGRVRVYDIRMGSVTVDVIGSWSTSPLLIMTNGNRLCDFGHADKEERRIFGEHTGFEDALDG
jgi:WD40 repeat protein